MKEILVCFVMLLLPILLFTYSNIYKKNFLNTELIENSYTIRVVSSNISLDRFYKNVEAENIIGELIDLSSPDPEKKLFFMA